MRYLKVDEYVERIASPEGTGLLLEELGNYMTSGSRLHGHVICDRVIRACNHQLGVEPLDFEHISQLVKLVELALHGYNISGEYANKTSPLYMEKIIFHIVKKLKSLRVPSICHRLGCLLYSRLTPPQQIKDYCVIVQNCFALFWNGLSAAKGATPNPKDKLQGRMLALRFLLLDRDSTMYPCSKVPTYTEDALIEFEKGCRTLTQEDASFLLQEASALLRSCWSDGQFGQGSRQSCLFTLFEVVLITVKLLCKAQYWDLTFSLMDDMESNLKRGGDCHSAALVLGRLAVKIHRSMCMGEKTGQVFRECDRALRSLPTDPEERLAHVVLEGCSLMMWAVEDGRKKGSSDIVLPAWFSFVEHQEQIVKRLKKNLASQTEVSRLQQSLCFKMYQRFVFTYESMLASQLEDGETLDRVLLYCQATAGLMMTELHKLSSDNIFVKAVTAVNNLACWLYNRKLYDQAFTLTEIVCRELCKNCPTSVSMDRFNHPFMLAVQSSRRGGQMERALDWVILWLKALGEKITSHMAEPVSLWVKTKADAALVGEKDIRLRTLRDGFGPDVPDKRIMLCLLEEELYAYKEVAGDTTQERYSTLCQLLDICHEESTHTHLRAVYLCEMAQVVCFQDFSKQTDCMAVDFTRQALQLLEEEPETAENAERLKDDKAYSLLWLYVCNLEKNIQEAIEKEKGQQDVSEQMRCVFSSIGTNDLDYEDKQKQQDSTSVYEGLNFNLASETEFCQPLERALELWSSLLQCQVVPSVRNPKRTCSSIVLTAALFRLMGKPLKVLEAYQLAFDLSRQLGDHQGCASSLCQSARLLLDLGAPELAQAQLAQAEQFLTSNTNPTSILAVLLRAQYCYCTGQVERGVSYLCEGLKKVNEQRRYLSCYLLRVLALQTYSSYLSLDTTELPRSLRHTILQHGMSSPDTALYESLRLLRSLVVTFVGSGLYGTVSSNSDTCVIDQGDNLVLKWQLLSEVLSCSLKLVAVRSSTGAVQNARLQCLEALNLAIKLQALSRCAELLVVKAELELMKGETEKSRFDLDYVRNLLEVCTDFSSQEQKAGVKIKPRKGRPTQKPQSPLPSPEDDCEGLLSTRWFFKEPVERDPTSSPPLKAKPRPWLSSLAHETDCKCPCCSEPNMGLTTARWAATQADLALQLCPTETRVGWKLYQAALNHCKGVTAKLEVKLANLFPLCGPANVSTKCSLMQDVVGRVYLHMALSGLKTRLDKVQGIWNVLEAGLAFVDSMPSPELKPLRAGLMATKAIALLLALTAQRNCTIEELFSNAWIWNPPKRVKEQESKPKTVPPPTSLKKIKDPVITVKDLSHPHKAKEAKKVKTVVPKINLPSSSFKTKSLVPMTPVMVKPNKTKFSDRELGCFDFDTEVPTVACTPVQRARGPPGVRTLAETSGRRGQFQVYQDLSPDQDKAQPVPAAPKRTKKSLFKVEFSDESDSETCPQAELKEKPDSSKKHTAATRSTRNLKTAPEATVGRAPPKRRVRGRKSTAVSQPISSEDEGPAPVRRGKSRAQLAGTKPVSEEDVEKMRTITEEMDGIMDLSIERLRTLDADNEDNATLSKNFGATRVLRCCGRICVVVIQEKFYKPTLLIQTPGQVSSKNWDMLLHSLSVEAVQSLLHSAWLAIQHFPPPNLYSTLCALLALASGQQDPITTAMLHTQSMGVTSRHHVIRHLATHLKKLRKTSSELSERMGSLSLDELAAESGNRLEKRLSQLETIFAFPSADPSTFPKQHHQEFMQQIKDLPSGVTVCVLSVLGVKPGEMGDTILLSRLEKGSAPVTVHIPTSQQQHPISWLVQEMDSILTEQKVVSSVSEKAKWWEGRRALDTRVEQLLEEMEGLLGCWRSFLLPLTSDPELSIQAKNVHKALSTRGMMAAEEMLKAVLSASPLLSQEELQRFSLGIFPEREGVCDTLLQTAVSRLSNREEPQGHVVLILDKYLQKLPWESISCLKPCSVSRMPSLQSLLGHCVRKESDPQCILKKGVDTKQVYYVLNPDGNLGDTEQQFKEWFSSKPEWQGVCGIAPDSDQLQDAVAAKDLYIYVGHGAGARFLNVQKLLKQEMRAASLLFGCSSAALAVRGDLEGEGIILNYLMAGCPLVLGNLWDVTDRDMDRFTKALLKSWLSAGPGSPLLNHIGPSRHATHLKHLIGAAPVVYGLPIHLQ
ncbi:separin [Lampris incognitus]|uniref:separin n=1 Tax=Lampris incognitus TaxID=2546036 RepID=UPI0024B4A00A|nr:separin [Lampris incognitus]